MELNAFETRSEPYVPATVVGLGTTALGVVAVVAAFAVDPLGPAFLLLTWAFFLGGVSLALVPGRARPVGIGLAVAGLALPLTAFVYLWVAVTGGVLLG